MSRSLMIYNKLRIGSIREEISKTAEELEFLETKYKGLKEEQEYKRKMVDLNDKLDALKEKEAKLIYFLRE